MVNVAKEKSIYIDKSIDAHAIEMYHTVVVSAISLYPKINNVPNYTHVIHITFVLCKFIWCLLLLLLLLLEILDVIA